MTTRVAPLEGEESEHRRLIAEAANAALRGKINALDTLTLTINSATTTYAHPLLSEDSALVMDPMTANAAAELYGGTMYTLTANRGAGSWTITNANNSNADRTFKVVILG